MNEAKAECAASDLRLGWHSIDWAKCNQTVRKLQARIVKATKEGRWNKVKTLQWLLTHSFSGKALAVKRVTENKGKKTAGVDKETWSTPTEKANAVMELKRRGYKASPLRRVLIPKKNGKTRPLGIPTMKDRAMQALYAMALDPIAETTGDPNSYGFRKSRCTADAREQCFISLARKGSAEWVLEGDIKGCFDNISHQWLISNVPTDKVMLQKWLEAGFIYNKELFPTEAGTPQGGIISPVLANLTLDGLEKVLIETYWLTKKGNINGDKRAKSKVNFIRYADDFIITGKTPEILEEVKTLVENFLHHRGLELEPTKTKITHIADGFDFLGWNFRKYNGKLLIKPSKGNIKSFLTSIRESIKGNKMAKQENLIHLLNPKIRGWANYHSGAVAKEAFGKVDKEIWQSVWRWATRRHPNKGKKWVKDRYFQIQDLRTWVFRTQEGKKLIKAADTPIVRQVKIKAEANPYDPEQEQYFEDRIQMQMKSSLKGNAKLLGIWTRQAGMCPNCSQWITLETDWHVHHVIPISEGGKDTMGNLRMLHPNCHRQLHNQVISNVDGSDNELIKA